MRKRTSSGGLRRTLTPLFAALLVGAAFLAAGISPARAQEQLYFDPGLTGTSNGSGGSGVWDSGTTANWVVMGGTGGDVVWDSTALSGAIFSNTTTANPTVTIEGGVTASGLAFGSGSNGELYTLTGAPITLTAFSDPFSNVLVTGGVIINSNIITNAVFEIGLFGPVVFGGSNTYTAETGIQAGATLSVTSTNALSANSNFQVDGTLALNGQNSTIHELDGSGVVENALNASGSTPATLVINMGGSDSSFQGVIQDGGTNSALSLTVINGTLYLGGSNTYTGITTIGNEGVVTVSQDANLGAAPASPVANQLTLDGGTLVISGTGFTMSSNRGITITSNEGTIDVESDSATLSYAGSISGTTGALYLSGAGTLALTGSSNIGGGNLHVDNGTLMISGSGTFTNNVGYIADDFISSNETAAVIVDGTGAAWINNSFLEVATAGTGTLTVENGGFVSSAIEIIVGDEAGSVGTILIESGGSVSSPQVVLGYMSNSASGMVTVTGMGSSLNADPLTVGVSGTGQLTVELNALVSATGGLIVGENSGSVGTVTVQTSGTLVSGSAVLGENSGASGMVTVTGTGSTWNAGSLTVGESGTGQVTVELGAFVSATGGLIVGENSGSVGTVAVQNSISGPTTLVTGSTVIGENSGASGAVSIGNNDTLWTTDALTIGQSGTGEVTAFNDGAISATNGVIIGQDSGGSGLLNVQNGGVLATTDVVVGESGSGQFMVFDGGNATLTGGLIVGDSSSGAGFVSVASSGTLTAASAVIGASGTGQLLVEDDSVMTATNGIIVGQNDGGNGSVTIEFGATLVTGSAVIGGSGTGQFTVIDGGTASLSGALIVGDSSTGVGVVSVASSSGVTTTSAVIGVSGSGQLTVGPGGAVSMAGGFIAGENGGAVGIVTGSDSGAISSGSAVIGQSGAGQLTLFNGGMLTATNGFIVGQNSGGFGAVSLDTSASITTSTAVIGASGTGQLIVGGTGGGGSLTAPAGLIVGQNSGGVGTMLVQNVGTVTSGSAVVGQNAGATGTVTVTDPGSLWSNTGNLAIGGSGTGSLLVENSANVTTTGSMAVGYAGSGTMTVMTGGTVSSGNAGIGILAGANGIVTVTGSGVWNISGGLAIGGGPTGPGGTGLLTILNGGAVNSTVGTIVWSGGTLAFGANPFLTGPLTFNGGTLLADATVALPNNATIAAGGMAANTNGSNLTLNGVLSGPGGLIKIGSGNLILGGVNTYAAGTNLAAGGIGLGSNATGAGGPIGTGALNITAATGNVFSSGADRILPNAISIGGGSTLNIIDDPTGTAHNLKLTGAINGAGGLTMNSSQTLTINGPDGYSGGTVINAGILAVNGAKALGTGNVFVFGGELTSDPQVINVGNNYKQGSGGTLLLTIDGFKPGQYDYLNVKGHAALGGKLILGNPNGITLTGGDQLTIVQAGNGISGKFGTINFGGFVPQGTILSPELIYGTHGVVFEAAQGSFTQFATTPNQMAIAAALNRIPFDSRAAEVLKFIDSQSVHNLSQELEDISPAGLSSIYEISFANANTQQSNLENRMQDIRHGATGFDNGLSVSNPEITKGYDGKNVLETGNDKNPYPTQQIPSGGRLGVFISGNGNFVDVGHDPNARGYDFDTGGVNIGIDYRVTDSFAVGITLGYANTEGSLDGRGSLGVNSGKGGVYATYSDKELGFYVDGYAGGGFNSYDTRRAALLKDATGATNGGEFNTFVSSGVDIKEGGFVFGPFGAVDYSYVSFDQFNERGSLAPLKILSQDQDSLRSELGVNVLYPVKTGGITITPQLRASWQHEFAYSGLPIDAEFNGTNDLFKTFGPKIGRDSALLEAGVRVQWTPMLATYLNYDGNINSTLEAHSVNGGLDLTF